MKKTSARGSAEKRAGKAPKSEFIVEAQIQWHRPLSEKTMERIAEAFHACEQEGRIYDVSVGGSLEERWIDVSFGLAHVETQSLNELVPIVRELIEEALSGNALPAGMPAPHVIDAMAFKPILSHYSS